MKSALIVFVRLPEIGKVKTRLAATIGNEAALEIYKRLLLHTLQISTPLTQHKFVFYAGEISDKDMWSGERYFKDKQADGDLGNRMQHAFHAVFSRGYERAVIIGSDCYELTTAIIEKAFEQLESKDIVIGPAQDGGYYLLGMKKVYQPLFTAKNWSTNTIYADTQKTIIQLGLTCFVSPRLSDVDEEKDVPSAWLNKT